MQTSPLTKLLSEKSLWVHPQQLDVHPYCSNSLIKEKLRFDNKSKVEFLLRFMHVH